MIAGFGLFIVCTNYLWKAKEAKVIEKSVRDMRNQGEVVEFCVLMIRLIRSRDKASEFIKLQGMLKINCQYFDQNVVEPLAILSSTTRVDDMKTDEDLIEVKWYEFLVLVLNEMIKRNLKTTQLRLMIAYIYYYKLRNKWKAVYALTDMMENKPSIIEQFSAGRIMKNIEKELQENEIKSNDSNAMDILTIFEFKNNNSNFQLNIDKAVKLQIDFWNELLDENPNIQKLISIASILTKKFEELGKLFQLLNSYEINNTDYMKLYSTFLQEIIHDEFESKRINEKIELMSKNRGGNGDLLDGMGESFGQNSKCLIITVSGNEDTLGEVVNIGNEVNSLLKIKPAEVVGNNVNMLMPEFYSVHHDDYMRRYLETGEARIIGKKRNIYALDKKGYLKGCSLYLKVLPDLSEGIHFIGMIRDFDTYSLGKTILESTSGLVSHYLIYDSTSGKIMGLSESLFLHFGLRASLFRLQSNNTPTIQHICPELMDPDVIKEMKGSEKGAQIYFDTSSLRDSMFYAGMNDSDRYSSLSESSLHEEGASYESKNKDEEKLKNFHRAKCRAWVLAVERSEMKDLNCIRFIELDNDENNFYRPSSKLQLNENVNKIVVDEEKGRDENHSLLGEDPQVNAAEEEIRQIKDSRALMNEKKNPKAIKTLQKVCIVLALISIASEIFLLVSRHKDSAAITSTVTKYLSLFRRNIILTNIGYYLRKYEMLIKYPYPNPATTFHLGLWQTRTSSTLSVRNLASWTW
jgi:PAS domain S-box-containing protein